MNSDSYFSIGHSHKICEDYALHYTRLDGVINLILCDGCSANTGVDFGARILAHSAKRYMDLWNLYDCEYNTFGSKVITYARDIIEQLKCSVDVLTSTLLVAQIHPTLHKVKAFMYGDGLYYHKNIHGIYTKYVDCYNMPDYLSYNLDSELMKQFQKTDYRKTIGPAIHKTVYPYEVKSFSPVVDEADISEGGVIGFCSDGICSFHDKDNNSIAWETLVPEFFSFKNTNGEFVQRRMSAFSRKCHKEGIKHLDDISCVAAVV